MLGLAPKGYTKVFPGRVFSKERSINEPLEIAQGIDSGHVNFILLSLASWLIFYRLSTVNSIFMVPRLRGNEE